MYAGNVVERAELTNYWRHEYICSYILSIPDFNHRIIRRNSLKLVSASPS